MNVPSARSAAVAPLASYSGSSIRGSGGGGGGGG